MGFLYGYGYSILDLSFVILFSIVLLTIALAGVFVLRTNLIITLISLEVILFVVNLNFIIFSNVLDDALGQLYALLVLSVAASESSIGLALLVAFYRIRGLISVDYLNSLIG